MYHKGFASDDADRYGPAIELVKELHRRIEEAEITARGSAQSAQLTPGRWSTPDRVIQFSL